MSFSWNNAGKPYKLNALYILEKLNHLQGNKPHQDQKREQGD